VKIFSFPIPSLPEMSSTKVLLLSLLFWVPLSAFAQQVAMPSEPAVIEVQPEFLGGIQGMYKHLSRNFRYPKSASRIMYMGKVILKFYVEADGSVTLENIDHTYMSFPIDLKKPLTEEQKNTAIKDVDLAVIDLLKSMPRWKAGTQNGKAVRVLYTIPLNLNLE
jgi:hypothetical protein